MHLYYIVKNEWALTSLSVHHNYYNCYAQCKLLGLCNISTPVERRVYTCQQEVTICGLSFSDLWLTVLC